MDFYHRGEDGARYAHNNMILRTQRNHDEQNHPGFKSILVFARQTTSHGLREKYSRFPLIFQVSISVVLGNMLPLAHSTALCAW